MAQLDREAEICALELIEASNDSGPNTIVDP